MENLPKNFTGVMNNYTPLYDPKVYEIFASVSVSDVFVAATFGILVNVVFLFTILLTSSLRSDPFLWKICSLLFWNILVCLNAIAQHCIHKESVLQFRATSLLPVQKYSSCRLWAVVENLRVPVALISFLSMVIDRLIEIVYVQPSVTSLLNRVKDIALLLLPWFLMLVAMVPFSVRSQTDGFSYVEMTCLIVPDSWLPSYIAIFELAPTVLLAILMEGVLILFAFKVLHQDNGEQQLDALQKEIKTRQTLNAVVLSCFVYLFFTVYNEVLMLKLSQCDKQCCTMILFGQKHQAFIASLLGHVGSPLLMLMIDELRMTLWNSFRFLLEKCKILNPRGEVMTVANPMVN